MAHQQHVLPVPRATLRHQSSEQHKAHFLSAKTLVLGSRKQQKVISESCNFHFCLNFSTQLKEGLKDDENQNK